MSFKNNSSTAGSSSTLYRRVWRWHFFASLLCLPFIFSLAATGSIYLFHRQLDDIIYADKLIRSTTDSKSMVADTPTLSARTLIDHASERYPGTVKSITFPEDTFHNVQVDVATKEGAVLQVFVDPVSGTVVGAMDASDRLMTMVKRVHSLAMLGVGGQGLIEIVAGWIIVLVITGAYLWWPRGRTKGVVSIRKEAVGRVWWRDVHAVAGAFAAIVILFLALTGMPWSVFWGKHVNQFLSDQGWGVPNSMWRSVPHSTLPAEALGDLPWNLQQQPIPASALSNEHDEHRMHQDDALHHDSIEINHSQPATKPIDEVVKIIHSLGMPKGYRLMLPRGKEGVYSAIHSSPQLAAQRVIHIDQYAGKVLVDVTPAQFGALGYAVEWGVSVHQGGEFGGMNLLIMLLGCLATMLLCVSGVVMWWSRRPQGQLAAPPRPRDAHLALGVVGISVTLGVVFPLLGASMLIACLVDYLLNISVQTAV